MITSKANSAMTALTKCNFISLFLSLSLCPLALNLHLLKCLAKIACPNFRFREVEDEQDDSEFAVRLGTEAAQDAAPGETEDAESTKRQGPGRPPKYSADMSVASMAAILTTMAGGAAKQVVRVLGDHAEVAQDDPARPFVCGLCGRRFKEVG